ncbi:hypothetical protein JCM11641_003530 [Rhodosporidiobolus odoratus]
MSFSSDASPTSSLPSLSPSSSPPSSPQTTDDDYRAPLSGEAPEPSIDGTSVQGGEGGVRATSLAEVGDEEKKLALSLKSQANANFTSSRYREALDLYTASLNKNPFDPIVWSNRAAVRLKLEEHGLAIADATRAIEIDSRAVKAYYRRGIANLAILKPKAAMVDLKQVVKLDPSNATAKVQLDATQKLVRKLAFEAAIQGKEAEAASITIRKLLDEGSAPIPTDYAGPQLPSDGASAEFIDALLDWFKEGKLVPRRIAWEITLGALERMREEETLVKVDISEGQTVNVIGDTHGQFYDFLHLLSLTGKPSPTHTLVFNGDFVDRGSWSTEIMLVLFAYKWLYPKNCRLLRGNHESSRSLSLDRLVTFTHISLVLLSSLLTPDPHIACVPHSAEDMNLVYGLRGEMVKKYGEQSYNLVEEAFTTLPLAALITSASPPRVEATAGAAVLSTTNPTLWRGRKRYFVVHGGLFSRDDVTLDDVRAIPRMKLKQPGQEGLMCEMLWTDPQDGNGRGPSKRGVGHSFGPDITKSWTEKNEITAVIRSHEVRQGGYSVEHGGLLVTVFSAPNYVDQVGNLAAFATIDETGEMRLDTFEAQPHPPMKPMAYAGGFGGMM